MASKVLELTYREVLDAAREVRTWKEAWCKVAPPRGPRGSAANRARVRASVRLLRAWSELGREGR